VLEHVLDPDQVMREITRVLSPKGTLLLTVPMSWNLHYEPFDFRRYTSYGIQQLLEAHGYEAIETKRIGGLFSLVGSRLVDGIAAELFHRLHFVPRRLRFCMILGYTIPVSLFFMALAWIGDDFQTKDAIGWAVLSRKR
jgi:SAM-dependent methyltransferase